MLHYGTCKNAAQLRTTLRGAWKIVVTNVEAAEILYYTYLHAFFDLLLDIVT